ncbi:PAS domain-containing sensor histidine kinase [Sulfuricella sp.]|uniref:PAS domain-containing sensor histidine kinase n=1 Tax=Sulfuricella sp. TaxID=2099377 RepID=UPI002B5BDFA6|nr:ATP-binding protein [Sulfuricella sp.]HUX64551.1 ATP-binding protein [Sulfuricella sp.]
MSTAIPPEPADNHHVHHEALVAAQFCPVDGIGESTWIEVIRKMDEVYSNLLQYQVALEEKNVELEETQQFVFSVLTSMSDVLIVCDLYGNVVEVNRALVNLVGRGESELRGSPVFDLFADECSREKARNALASRSPVMQLKECEAQMLGAAGETIPVALNCAPRYDLRGREAGFVMVGRPVGELRRAYQELNDTHEALKRAQQHLVHSEKMVSLGRLVAGVAHELNNPISFVLGNIHALQRYSQRLKSYLDTIHGGASEAQCEDLRKELRIDRILSDLESLIEGTVEGAERTRDIVEGLKRFSAKDKDESSQFNLAEVIAKAVHWVTRSSSAQCRVSCELPDDIPVLGNPGQIQQVVINLVQNALDATRGREVPALDIGGRIADGQVEISFRDNGPGIEPQHLNRVFDPFFTTKPVGKGTGLGLSISYGIIDRHGGRLSVANHADGGAVFSLRLPLA